MLDMNLAQVTGAIMGAICAIVVFTLVNISRESDM
jgi:hypothetical protein